LALLVIGMIALAAVPASGGERPVKGPFSAVNPDVLLLVKKDRASGTAYGLCPNDGEGLRYFPKLAFKVKNGKIKVDKRTKFVDEDDGNSKVRVTLNAEFVTSKKAVGAFRIYAPARDDAPKCNKKRKFTAKWKQPIPPGQG
jgi:hypothetical protein